MKKLLSILITVILMIMLCVNVYAAELWEIEAEKVANGYNYIVIMNNLGKPYYLFQVDKEKAFYYDVNDDSIYASTKNIYTTQNLIARYSWYDNKQWDYITPGINSFKLSDKTIGKVVGEPIKDKNTNEIIYNITLSESNDMNEYLLITQPRENYITVDKYVTYWINYKVHSENINDILINVKNQSNQNLIDDINIKNFEFGNHEIDIQDGYIEGFLKVEIEYNENFIGSTGINVKIDNYNDSTYKIINRNINIKAFSDSNFDGIDDDTGESIYRPPGSWKPDDITDSNLDIMSIVNVLKNAFSSITSAISSVIQICGMVFSFLPAPMLALIFIILTILGLTTILKLLRG